MPIFYETHLLEGADFPYIFHSDTLIRTRRNDSANWHANMEILSITEGSGQCICDAKSYDVLPGDLVVIGSNVIHSAISEDCLRYDCLIVDRGFCKENRLPVEFVTFPTVIRGNRTLCDLFAKVREATALTEDPYLAARVRAALLSFLVPLYAGYCVVRSPDADFSGAEAMRHVKNAVEYINRHLTEEISLDRVAAEAGVSRYYLCRQFRKYIGQTVFEYLNVARCKNAHVMIVGGSSVSTAALSSGFSNLSYFTRTYKKYFGVPPSKTVKKTYLIP